MDKNMIAALAARVDEFCLREQKFIIILSPTEKNMSINFVTSDSTENSIALLKESIEQLKSIGE